MKTKHTKVRLSLLVIVTALTFGLGGSYAQARDFQLTKTINHNKVYLGVPDTYDGNEVRNSEAWKKHTSFILLDTVTLNEGETFSYGNIELLTDIPVDNSNWYNSRDYHMCGKIEYEISGRGFGTPDSFDHWYYYRSSGGMKFWVGNHNGELRKFGNSDWPIKGVAEIQIKLYPYRKGPHKDDKGWYVEEYLQHWRVYYSKNIESYAQSSTQLQALVLPKNTKNTRLIVESSEDLVNWAIDTPGPKTTTNRERFFRLRAVKE
jgi:hypothetical protein